MPHVAAASPVLAYLNLEAGNVGIVYGIEIESFEALSEGFVFVAGGPFENDDDLLVDDWYAEAESLQVGDTVTILGNDLYLRGTVENGKGARVFLPIGRMQKMLSVRDRATMIYVRVDEEENIPVVQHALYQLRPRYRVDPLREYASVMTSSNMPGLNTFVNSMVSLGVVVGFLVIFLSMYTGILERTREIGILKSLGASNFNIVTIVMRESVTLCLAGVVVGIVMTFVSAWLLKELFPTIAILITPGWLFKASALAVLGGVLGAVYPAWLATRQDAIAALAYE